VLPCIEVARSSAHDFCAKNEPKTHMRSPLTDLAARAAKPPAVGTSTLWDSTVRGLGLRCSQGGTKTFFVMLGKERSRVRIGRYLEWSVKDARAQAVKILAARSGKPAPKRLSFETAFEQFKQTHTSQKRASTRHEIERLITRHFLPRLRTRSKIEIGTKDITDITDKLLPTPGTCSHAYAAIRKPIYKSSYPKRRMR
jgi:Arm DNA-binding domain